MRGYVRFVIRHRTIVLLLSVALAADLFLVPAMARLGLFRFP